MWYFQHGHAVATSSNVALLANASQYTTHVTEFLNAPMGATKPPNLDVQPPVKQILHKRSFTYLKKKKISSILIEWCSDGGDNDDEMASDNSRYGREQVSYFSRYEKQCKRLAAQPRSICCSRFRQRCQQRSLEDTRRLSHLCRFLAQPFQFY